MTDTTPARRLGALVADWKRNPFQAISNEDKARQKFLADLAEVLGELADAEARLAFIATTTFGLSDTADADISMVAYALTDLAKGEATIAEAFEAMPEEWRPDPPAVSALPGLGLNDTEAS